MLFCHVGNMIIFIIIIKIGYSLKRGQEAHFAYTTCFSKK
jgi:hypothetical protein